MGVFHLFARAHEHREGVSAVNGWDMVRMLPSTRAAIEAASASGLPTQKVLGAIGNPAWSVDIDDDGSTFRANDSMSDALLVVHGHGGVINVRYWSAKGAPDIEFSYIESSGIVNFAKVDGKRAI